MDDTSGHVDPDRMDATAAALVATAGGISAELAILRLPIRPPASDVITLEICNRLDIAKLQIAHIAESFCDELHRLAEVLTTSAFHLETEWRWITTVVMAPHVPGVKTFWRISPRRLREPISNIEYGTVPEFDESKELLSWAVHLCNGSNWPAARLGPPDFADVVAQLAAASVTVREAWSAGQAPAEFIERLASWVQTDLGKSLAEVVQAEARAADAYSRARQNLTERANQAAVLQAQAISNQAGSDWVDGLDTTAVADELARYRKAIPQSIELAQFALLKDGEKGS